MLDHIVLSVSDYIYSKHFYLKALEPLGYQLLLEHDDNVAGFGIGRKPYFIIHGAGKTSPNIHLAFLAQSRIAVDAFYHLAMQAGGVDNGEPGIRAIYHPNYYAAFILDPDGHNIEAVCHIPE